MAGDDSDFAAYVAARWATLVRTLVLAGWEQPVATAVVLEGLASCRASWEHLRHEGDVDADVCRVVLGRRHRQPAPPQPVDAGPDASDEELTWAALASALAALPADQRMALALRFVAGLSDDQLAQALDVDHDVASGRVLAGLDGLDLAGLRELRQEPMLPRDRLVAESFHTAAAAVDVPPTSYEQVVATALDQRRRRTHLAAVVAAAVVVAAVVATWLATRSASEPPEPAPRVALAPNPADVSWYAGGRLHLRDVVVEVPGLVDLTEVGPDAAYLDERGRVRLVDAQGRVRDIGSADPDGRVVGSAETGWVTWVDPDRGRLVIYSVARRRRVAEAAAAPGSRPLAIDQGRVFWAGPGGAFTWAPGDTVLPAPADLVDVSSATRVYQQDDRMVIQQSFFNVSFVRDGVADRLSPGGTYLLARPPGTGTATAYRPRLYDTGTGRRLPSGVSGDERVVDAAFGQHLDIVYAVVQVADLAAGADLEGRSSALVVLRTCDVRTADCHDVAPLTGGGVLLAH